jgi:hypothetical protein
LKIADMNGLEPNGKHSTTADSKHVVSVIVAAERAHNAGKLKSGTAIPSATSLQPRSRHSLLLRQSKPFYYIVRCLLFAKVSNGVAARLDAGGRLSSLDDWRSGDTVRVITTIAPFGGEVVLWVNFTILFLAKEPFLFGFWQQQSFQSS